MLCWTKHPMRGYYEAHTDNCGTSYYIYKNETAPPWHVYIGGDYYDSADTLPKAKALAYKHAKGK